MKIFDSPNMKGFTCPICKTNRDMPVCLIGIDGTEDGHNIETVQVHVSCLDLRMYDQPIGKIFAQIVPNYGLD